MHIFYFLESFVIEVHTYVICIVMTWYYLSVYYIAYVSALLGLPIISFVFRKSSKIQIFRCKNHQKIKLSVVLQRQMHTA